MRFASAGRLCRRVNPHAVGSQAKYRRTKTLPANIPPLRNQTLFKITASFKIAAFSGPHRLFTPSIKFVAPYKNRILHFGRGEIPRAQCLRHKYDL